MIEQLEHRLLLSTVINDGHEPIELHIDSFGTFGQTVLAVWGSMGDDTAIVYDGVAHYEGSFDGSTNFNGLEGESDIDVGFAATAHIRGGQVVDGGYAGVTTIDFDTPASPVKLSAKGFSLTFITENESVTVSPSREFTEFDSRDFVSEPVNQVLVRGVIDNFGFYVDHVQESFNFDPSILDFIYINLDSGDDFALRVGDVQTTLLGEDGNDYLIGGNGDDRVSGGLGDDILVGGAGKDEMIGGDGNDLFFALDGERDTIRAGGGVDAVFGENNEKLKDVEMYFSFFDLDALYFWRNKLV